MSSWGFKRFKSSKNVTTATGTSGQKVHSISSVGDSLTVDQSARQRRYFISMMIRTACFILTVVLPNPYRWIALFGAVTLPYIAVVIANAGRETVKNPAPKFNARELK
jgi:hypothetical protein